MIRTLAGVGTILLLAGCVTTESAKTSDERIAVTCEEDIKISLGKLMGVSCTFANKGDRPTNVVLRSVKTNSSTAQVLSPQKLDELGTAMRNMQQGTALSPGTVGFVYFGTLATANTTSGGAEALIPMALATGFLALAAAAEDEEDKGDAVPQRTYHEKHMLHGPMAVDVGVSLKREVFIGPVEGTPPESLTMCFDAPTSECIAVGVQPDASRFRRRS